MQISRQLMAFAKLVPKHLETLKAWVDELLESLRVLFGGLPKQLTDFFTKFGISLQKAPQGVLYSGIPVKVGDDVYALIKDGKELFRGTKAEIEALAEKLKKMSDKEAKAYIDELESLSKKAKLFNFKKKELLDFYLNENKGINSWVAPLKVKYLNESEKLKHQLFIKEGKLFDVNGKPFNSLDLDNRFNNGKAIFVMDEYGRIFASTKNKPTAFHHSSFLAGKPVAFAGEIEVIDGIILSVSNNSGHYQPGEEFLNQFLNFLNKLKVKTNSVEKVIIK